MTGGPHIETRRECHYICNGNGCKVPADPDFVPESCPIEYRPMCCAGFGLDPEHRFPMAQPRIYKDLTDARLALANHLASEHGMNVPADQLPVWPTGEPA